jgi:conjugal transfer/entry exclusion protein
MKCKILVMTMFLISSFVQSQCYAAYTVYDPRNHAANVETKAPMIQQVLNSSTQLEYQLKNMESLD